ncbi:hypothetical protein [Aquimarina celericrescens]|uniref:YD repeat-containing protein n=1 Tax=Aquimarina celericrescens TaxID=1964542 RepID=A0ABW5AV13_9FLAO|nr:hypothetical protein [Aquimarina celericrescens]
MKNTKTNFSHRVIAVFFAMTFLQTLIPYNQLWANNNGPNAPEAASFEPIDATDMVNLLTGDFTYVLPLLNVPSPEGGYPLALAYHAGIAMDQEASWVGLGWSLNPGAINRYVSGVPDDWKSTKKYSVVYDEGGVARSYTGGVSVGWGDGLYSAGLYASYSENRSSNGENSYDFSVGGNYGPLQGSIGSRGTNFGIGIPLGAGFKASIGTSGVGLSYERSSGANSIGLSVNQSFKDGSTLLSLNGSSNYGASLGVSLSSRDGLTVSVMNGSFDFSGSESLSRQLSVVNRTLRAVIPIPTPSGAVNIDAAYRKTKYWVYENDYSIFDGSLYSGNISNSLENSLFDYKVAFDSYESYYETDRKQQSKEANYSLISYDSYSVSGQGISGSIKPYIFEDAVLRNQQRTIDTDTEGNSIAAAFYDYPTGTIGDKFTKGFNDIHFYFENENSSFLKVSSGNWTSSNNNYSSIFNLNTSNSRTDTSINVNGIVQNGYNTDSKRMRKGSFIETFTNQQILDAPSRIVQPQNFNRNRSRVPRDGIGAYKITTTDGKTYHYSIPVYQHEKFSRVAEVNRDINKQFSEEVQLDPYATHWLLTAITGPDYVDTNNNYLVDEADYGYWVEFNYGMWSEGFGWRTPTTGYQTSEKTKTYQWGIKEIYYLDKIKTRTHTALFVKENRLDNLSSSSILNVGSRSNPKVYNDIHIKDFIIGDDGKSYFNGVYDEVNPRFGTFYIESRHKFFLNLNEQKSLKLKKIILLKNSSSYANISKTNSSEENEITGGEIAIEESFQQFDLLGRDIGTLHKPITDRTWKANFYKNILDTKDIESLNDIDNDAIQIIDFNTSYNLVRNTPNSKSNDNEKLTLDQVRFRGKKGKMLMPPYLFDYNNKHAEYNNNAKDVWGYRDDTPASWSLKKITTPLGSSISVEYEEDKFRYEAAITAPAEVNKNGGGLRVKNLILALDNKEYITSYNYNIPGTTTSSGVTSYAPAKNEKEVKYIGEIPGPSVMYEYVSVEHKFSTNQIKFKDVFRFNVLQKMQEKNGGFEMGSMLSLKKTQNTNQNINVNGNVRSTNFSKFELVDHTASLGSLISKKSFNGKGQLMSNIENEYYSPNEIQQGAHQETNKMYKSVREGSVYKNLLSTSSKTKLPNVLKSTTNYSGNQKTTSHFDEYNFLTGQATVTRSSLSDGTNIITKSFPAHDIYAGMGSKADNSTNKNMLSQIAANLTQININDTWKTINAGITTWTNNWSYRKFDGSLESTATGNAKIWRKHKAYVWKGDVDTNGAYLGYTGDFDNFNWQINGTQTNPKWINTSTVSLYDHYSMPLETLDINNNKVATKMGDNNSKVFAVANAGYKEMFYSGAEDLNVKTGYFSGEVYTDATATLSNTSHTGKYSISVGANKKAFAAKLDKGEYKVSVWVNKDAKFYLPSLTRLKVGSNVISYDTEEVVNAGDWVQYNFYTGEISPGQEVYVYNTNRNGLYDDFRVHPIESSMTSYVYNEWDELTHIIGPNNLATKYEYDDVGRLERTYSEVVDANGVTGGFKLAKEVNYNYKKVAEVDANGNGIIDPVESYPPLGISLYIDSTIDYATEAVARGIGGSGSYQYRWAISNTPIGSNPSYGAWGSSSTKTIYDACGETTYVQCQVKDTQTQDTSTRSTSRLRSCSGDGDPIIAPAGQQQ